jgi:photosystem II stability/assembly factor-like uncharacterized protein
MKSNKFARLLLLLSLLILHHSYAYTQDYWGPYGGPLNVDITEIKYNFSDDIFVGTKTGIYRSTDNGINWTNINNAIPYYNISCIAISPNNDIYLGTVNGSLYRSTDNGNNWITLISGPTAVSHFDIKLNSYGHIYLGSFGISWSTDNGLNWSSHVFPNMAFVQSIFIDHNNNIYVGNSDGKIHQSLNYGLNWTEISPGWNGFISKIHMNGDGYIYAALRELPTAPWKIYRSKNIGQSWAQIGYTLSVPSIFDIFTNYNNHIFIATGDSGVYRFKNIHRNWEKIESGLQNNYVRLLYLDNRGYLTCGTYGNGIFKSILSTTLFANKKDTLIFESTELGSSKIDSMLIRNMGDTILTIHSIYSTDSSFSVSPSTSIINTSDSQYIKVKFSPENLGLNTGIIFFMSNANTSPDQIQVVGRGRAAILELSQRQITFPPTPLNQSFDTLIYVSNIGNDTLKIFEILGNSGYFSYHSASSIIYPGDFVTDTIRFENDSLGTFSGTLIIGSNSISSPDTIFVSGSTDTSFNILKHEENAINRYILYQNYPNPFNPSTTFEFDLPEKSAIILSVYNLLGERVATVFSKHVSAGKYQIEWDASHFASGIYIYRMEAGNFIDIKKFILMK